jgi:hypothetical protein
MTDKNTQQALAGRSLGAIAGRDDYVAPAIIALGTLAELTEGNDYGRTDDHDDYGSTPYVA